MPETDIQTNIPSYSVSAVKNPTTAAYDTVSLATRSRRVTNTFQSAMLSAAMCLAVHNAPVGSTSYNSRSAANSVEEMTMLSTENFIDEIVMLEEELIQLASLSRGSTGDDEVTPPTKRAWEEAIRFVSMIPLSSPSPKIAIAEDGEIEFYWRDATNFIDVSFYGDGSIYYYVRIISNGIDHSDTEKFRDRALPEQLVAALTSLDHATS